MQLSRYVKKNRGPSGRFDKNNELQVNEKKVSTVGTAFS